MSKKIVVHVLPPLIWRLAVVWNALYSGQEDYCPFWGPWISRFHGYPRSEYVLRDERRGRALDAEGTGVLRARPQAAEDDNEDGIGDPWSRDAAAGPHSRTHSGVLTGGENRHRKIVDMRYLWKNNSVLLYYINVFQTLKMYRRFRDDERLIIQQRTQGK